MRDDELARRLTEDAEVHPPGTPWMVGDVLLTTISHGAPVPPGWTLQGGNGVIYRVAYEPGTGDARIAVAKPRSDTPT